MNCRLKWGKIIVRSYKYGRCNNVVHFDNVDIGSYFTTCECFVRQRSVYFVHNIDDIGFYLTSLTPSASPIIIITIITISGSLKLFIRLNFACQGNPLFDIFIWNSYSNNTSFSLSLTASHLLSRFASKYRKFYVTSDEDKRNQVIGRSSHLCVGFLCIEQKNRYSCKRIQKNRKLFDLFIKLSRFEMMKKRKFCNKQPFHLPMDCHEILFPSLISPIEIFVSEFKIIERSECHHVQKCFSNLMGKNSSFLFTIDLKWNNEAASLKQIQKKMQYGKLMWHPANKTVQKDDTTESNTRRKNVRGKESFTD